MNIIFVPKGRGRHTSLGPFHLMIILFIGIIVPAVVGGVGYRIYLLLNRDGVQYALQQLRDEQQDLTRQRRLIMQTRGQTETHLTALATRLGSLQAQVLRLNALGGRLTRMAHIDDVEFDFTAEPAVGGPETASAPMDSDNFITTLNTLEQQVEHHQSSLTALETLLSDRHMEKQVTPSGWPVYGGWVSSGFGWRNDPLKGYRGHHEGIDIASPFGTPIKAMANGVVSFSGEKGGYGFAVDVNHGNGTTTRYGHASALLVKVGDRVQKGQPIALVGSTGLSTGPHLHFEVRHNDRTVNPAPYLQQIGLR